MVVEGKSPCLESQQHTSKKKEKKNAESITSWMKMKMSEFVGGSQSNAWREIYVALKSL